MNRDQTSAKILKITKQRNQTESELMDLKSKQEKRLKWEKKNYKKTYEQHYYPEGGWGWIILSIAIFINIITTGFILTVSNLSVAITKRFGYYSGWLSILPLAVSMAISPLVRSYAIRKKSTRLCAVCSGLLIALSYLFASFANQFHQIAISFGVIFAIGHGMASISAQIMLSQYFKKKRFYIEVFWMITNGLSIATQPFIVYFILQHFDWRLSMQLLSIISAAIFFISIFYRPASLYHPQRRAILHLRNQKQKVIEKNIHGKPILEKLTSLNASKPSKKKEEMFYFFYPKNFSLRIIFLTTIITSYSIYLPLFSLGDEIKESKLTFVVYSTVGVSYSIGVSLVALTTCVFRSFYCSQYYYRYLKLQICEFMLALLALIVFLYPFCSSRVQEAKINNLQKMYVFGSYSAFYGFSFGSFEFALKVYTFDRSKSNQFMEIWSFLQLTKSCSIVFGHLIQEFILAKYNWKLTYFLNAIIIAIGILVMYQINRRFRKQKRLEHKQFRNIKNLKETDIGVESAVVCGTSKPTKILMSDSLTDSDDCVLEENAENSLPMVTARNNVCSINDTTAVTGSDNFITSCCDQEEFFIH